MTLIDILIVLAAIAMAIRGYHHGLVVSALSLGGFVGGAIAGARIGPELLEGGADSPYAGLTALAGGFFLGAIVAVVAEWAGQNLRVRLIRGRVLTAIDGAGGAALLAALALVIAWVLGVVALNTPGLSGVREPVQRSHILRALNDALPPSGPILNVLNRVDPRPELTGPAARVRAPDPQLAEDPEIEAAAGSVVRILGTACGLGVEGSGWVAEPETVVTNAHVVAGQDDTAVHLEDGSEFDVTVVHYEPANDLAVLRVDGLALPALPLAPDPEPGTSGAIVGYPQNGPLSIEPARLGETAAVTSEDSYGNGPINREMTPLRGEVRPGNSGGPVIDTAGQVLTTVFASAVTRGPPNGLGVPNSAVSNALQQARAEVSTGPCAG